MIASLVADEIRAALSAADDADATPAERAEMLMEIAMGLQLQPKSPDQLHSAVTLYDKALTVCPEDMRSVARAYSGAQGNGVAGDP